MIYSWGGETVRRRFVQLRMRAPNATCHFVVYLAVRSWSSQAISCFVKLSSGSSELSSLLCKHRSRKEVHSVSERRHLHIVPAHSSTMLGDAKPGAGSEMRLQVNDFDHHWVWRAKLQTTCEQRSVHCRHLRRHAAGADLTVRTPTIAVRASPPTRQTTPSAPSSWTWWMTSTNRSTRNGLMVKKTAMAKKKAVPKRTAVLRDRGELISIFYSIPLRRAFLCQPTCERGIREYSQNHANPVRTVCCSSAVLLERAPTALNLAKLHSRHISTPRSFNVCGLCQSMGRVVAIIHVFPVNLTWS